MARTRAPDMDLTAIRCGPGGLLPIAVVGGAIGWAGSVLAERVRKADAGFRFRFRRGSEGAVEGWGPEVKFAERVRVMWRRDQEAVIAIGPDERHSDLYLVTCTANPDRVTMPGEGRQSGTLRLLRQGGSRAR